MYSLKRMRKSRGPSIYFCTWFITIISLILYLEQHCRSPVKKLEEEKTTRLQGWEEKKNPRYGKNKTYFNLSSKWLKRMSRDQENVFLFEFGLFVPTVLKCLLSRNFCRRSLPTWRKVIPISSFLLQLKIFLMYIM